MENYLSRVVRDGLSFGESPRWHEGRLWYSDFYRHAVFSMAADGSGERLEVAVPTQPSGLGWDADGTMYCVSMLDQRVLRVRDGDVTPWADVSEYCGFWANDMVVSADGHCYVGNFGFDLDQLVADSGLEGLRANPAPTTNLVVLDPAGAVLQVVGGLAFPNGSTLTPDGATLIVAETLARRLTAFRVNPDGSLSERRVWAELASVAPDGICLDEDGQVWLANAATNQCLRVREGGEITATVTTTQRAFACALGGDERRSLYVTSAPTSSRFHAAAATHATIEVVDVATPGAGRP